MTHAIPTELQQYAPAGSELERFLLVLLNLWPEHAKHVRKSFEGDDPALAEDRELIARLILQLGGGDLPALCESYRWLCDQVNVEELNFRRTGKYRFSRFQEVGEFVYHNPDYMGRYMHGLLLSQLLWRNHSQVFSYLKRDFLAQMRHGYEHLEIGPGHGLLTFLAASDPRCGQATAWDISATSLEQTRAGLARLGFSDKVRLETTDATKESSSTSRFDSIVLSEILEHVEDPRSLLAGAARLLTRDGRIFVNVPANSPALDHIYQINTPEEAVELVRSAGLTVTDSRFFPMTGVALERARRLKATISCVVVAQMPR